MIALAIGHSRSGDNGAVSVGGVSEHAFNTDIGERTKAILDRNGIESEVITEYIGGSYSVAMSWVAERIRDIKADLAVELHFNSASPSANGHEFLYWKTSTNGKKLAESFAKAYGENFPLSRARQDAGTLGISGGERGSQFLKKTHCPSVILEPFFGSNAIEWEAAKTSPERIANAYAAAIMSITGVNQPIEPPAPQPLTNEERLTKLENEVFKQ